MTIARRAFAFLSLAACAAFAHAQVPMPFPVGVPFIWLGTATADLKKRLPDNPNNYVILFEASGQAAIRLDCNNGRARWARDGGTLAISPIAGTKKGCNYGSMDVAFATDLGEVTGWRYDGTDLLLLGRDGRAMLFAAKPRPAAKK